MMGTPPCGYCLKASMTAPVRHSRVGGNLQGGSEADSVGCVVLLSARVTHRPSGLRIKSAMTGWSCLAAVDAGAGLGWWLNRGNAAISTPATDHVPAPAQP